MSKLSSLVVDLQVQSAALRQGMNQANGHLKKFGDQASKVGKLVAGAFAAKLTKDAVVGLASFVQRGAQAVDAMGKMAQAAGVPTEAMRKLAYAANFSGVSTEELGANLQRLSKHMSAAAAGGRAG